MSIPPRYEPEDAAGGYPPPREPVYPFGGAHTPLDDDGEAERDVSSRVSHGDPTFGYIIGVALSVGLIPLIPDNTDLRFVIVWSVLALFGVMAWLLGETERIERQEPYDLIWGIVFGVIIGTPLLAVGSPALAATADRLFRANIGGQIQSLSPGAALALLVFVQPLAETLFFRGLFQSQRPFWMVGLLASLWSILLFLPLIDLRQTPLVGVVIGIALLMMNLIYSYVRHRNGLAAAWLCQITLNVILLFIPFIAG